jgi:teichoic acid transport system ATP-binding protein
MAAAEPLAKTAADPMVVVDNLHVVYRVFGSKSDKGTAATALWRILRRQRRPSVREVHAIRGISFVANRGDAVGVIGRNGSGKSTLLRAIAGLLPPEQGAVYTTGHASLLGVNAALLDDLTGERNVVVCGLAMGMTPREVKDKYQGIVDFSGVGDFINLPMRAYSTGMGSRLRFAIASARSHEVLLIDEALVTGDAEFRVRSRQRIEELRAQAGTVFIVAHSMAQIEETCNRVIWLEKGQIVRAGDDVPAIIDAYLAATGGEPLVREGAKNPLTPCRPGLPGTAAVPGVRDREAGPAGQAGSARRAGPPQLQHHPGAAAGRRAGGHLTALRPGQLPPDVQAEPDAAEPAPVTRLALHETLEDALVITRCDADPLVVDGDLDPLPGRPRPHRDRPATR